ncbi:hypothetical protein A1O3_05418 [Capronia epimyces CBS 606.96]|uniref:NCS1 family nucleobase:cation symporter-1 n=1 Tax=Capronia epimyces CBS 606.96 TaxID=1182542 RepID=W9Y693_9EURO|nr:uncharacterized protein A1O3_05418 [Capronia epimyces CBS 606.96]EXJ84746.1 hypothetical protein A1O3_05418 [Capronia epimyces CBS 606.96]
MSSLLARLRVHDSQHGRRTDRWTNADILPVLAENRNFNTKSYFGFWVSAGIAATYWTMGSTAIAAGLSVGEAIPALLIGAIISAIVTCGCSEFGLKYHLGFPMLSRAVFGMYGSYFVVILKCFSNFVYCGIQTYWGGIAMRVMLAAIFPSFYRMKNTIPESANVTTQDLIGTIIYFVVFVALIMVRPYKLQPFFLVSFVGVILTILGMFIWAMAKNHGAGDLVTPTLKLGTGTTVFVFFQSICTMATTFTGVGIRHSDWTRYAKTPRAARLGFWIACPLTVSIAAIFGVFVTSATKSMYGKIIWQPMSILVYIQQQDYSSTTRAGTFFAGLGWFMSQIAVNVSSNAVATGMDLSSILPEWISQRRGSVILALVGIAMCPWNLVNSPGTFITVIGSLGIFIAPLIGIMLADYWVVRRQAYNVPHLYIGNRSSIYWYHWGLHWRAFVTWLSLIWVSMPGLVASAGGHDLNESWRRIFRLAFLIGLVGGFCIYTGICYVSPIPGAHDFVPYDFSNEELKNVEEVMGQEMDMAASENEKGKITESHTTDLDLDLDAAHKR